MKREQLIQGSKTITGTDDPDTLIAGSETALPHLMGKRRRDGTEGVTTTPRYQEDF